MKTTRKKQNQKENEKRIRISEEIIEIGLVTPFIVKNNDDEMSKCQNVKMSILTLDNGGGGESKK